MTRPAPDAQTVADLRPQLVCSVADAELGALGWVVLDRALPTAPSGGGIRLAPDLTLDEVAAVARAMTLKWAFLNIPHGGAKAGIAVPEELLRTRRTEVMRAFGRGIRPLLEHGVYFTGPDLGTTLDDANAVRRAAGMASEEGPDRDGGVATATTVVQAVREAVAHAGMTLTGASVAVEGFGRVGRHIATRLAALGARIVAASVREGAVHAPDGLRLDDDAWLSGGAGRRIPRAELLALPVDVLVPCARSWTIDADNADDVAAHVIVPGANTPLTAEAERALVGRGVTVVPDFVANCGGILYPHMRYRGFGFDVFARVVETALAERMRGVLAKAQAEGKRPSEVAERIAWRNFDRHAELLRELPDRAAARQLVLVRRHGIRAFPARVAGELHARVPNLSRAVGSAALQRYLAATLAADGE